MIKRSGLRQFDHEVGSSFLQETSDGVVLSDLGNDSSSFGQFGDATSLAIRGDTLDAGAAVHLHQLIGGEPGGISSSGGEQQ
jgi:hypothetical protein